MLRFIIAFILSIVTSVWAAEDSRDTYPHRSECPQNGPSYKAQLTADSNNFVRCQCTSYVAHKLNELWGNASPKFTNQYYNFDRWGNAKDWFNRARSSQAEIGVTGARDDFAWDESIYNAVFPGDVAYWDTPADTGHVAFVKSASPGPGNRGVGCVTWSQYNITPYEFSEVTMCRNQDGTFPSGFPKYFLHIDKDRTYCRANPTVDTCATLMGRQKVAGLAKYGGLGGFGSGSSFNLKQDTDILDPATGTEWIAGQKTLIPGMTVRIRTEVKAVNGNTTAYMRPGKDKVEVDFYVRLDDGEWIRISRQYIRATNLSSGDTKTESVLYTIPRGVREVSFKVKIDAEDEASESNEGDNWSRVETFTVRKDTLLDTFLPVLQLLLYE